MIDEADRGVIGELAEHCGTKTANSEGDAEMLQWTQAGSGARLMMLVYHDDAKREYAYGPAGGLPATKVGTFSDALMAEAKKSGWIVISMKKDWKSIFRFDSSVE